jgi:hypothetical protein
VSCGAVLREIAATPGEVGLCGTYRRHLPADSAKTQTFARLSTFVVVLADAEK